MDSPNLSTPHYRIVTDATTCHEEVIPTLLFDRAYAQGARAARYLIITMRRGSREAIPYNNDADGACGALSNNNDTKGRIGAVPSANDKRGTICALRSNSATLCAGFALPTNNDTNGPICALPNNNDTMVPISARHQVITIRRGLAGTLPYNNDTMGRERRVTLY